MLKKSRLTRDQSGISVTEFGLVAPVVLTMLMGVLEIGHGFYVRSVINGAMQDASRSSSMEEASAIARQQVIDLRVNNAIKNVIPTAISVNEDGTPLVDDDGNAVTDGQGNATVVAERRFYKTFSEAAAANAEEWVDENENGTCDNDETFIDVNDNEIWDEDGGADGQGLARDVVVMKVRIKYKRLFPVASFIGLSDEVIMESDSVLANQPYAEQTEFGAATEGTCANDD